MQTVIEDGTGSSSLASVVNHELQVTTESEALKANARGDAYTAIVSNVDPGGAGEDWFYMMNNTNRNLVIYKIEGWCVDANEEWNILVGATDDGTGNGDTVAIVNNNTAFSSSADVYCASDETDLAIVGGTLLTTLKFHATTLRFTTFEFPAGIILAPGTRLHMEAAVGDVVDMHLYFYMCD